MYLRGLGAGVERFGLVHQDTGAVESGACYPGCSISNIPACRPLTFANQADFNNYTQANGETPISLGAAMPGTQEWNYLRDQAFSRCMNVPVSAIPTVVPQPVAAPPAGGPPTIVVPATPDSSSTTIVLRGGTSTNISQPQTPGVFTAPTPSQVLDTGGGQPTTPGPVESVPVGVYIAAAAALFFLARGVKRSI